MQRNFRKDQRPRWKRYLEIAGGVLAVVLFALFMDWLILNWLMGCCEGGVCWPDIYPQCRNEHYEEFYGKNAR